MIRKIPFLIMVIGLISLLHVNSTLASSAQEIDAEVDATLAKFKTNVEGADEYLKMAKGVLVIPEVKKVGLIVGAEWGKGALRIDGKTVEPTINGRYLHVERNAVNPGSTLTMQHDLPEKRTQSTMPSGRVFEIAWKGDRSFYPGVWM